MNNQFWVEKISEGLVYFNNGSDNLIIPLGLLPGKVAKGDILRINFTDNGTVKDIKVVLKNITERELENF